MIVKRVRIREGEGIEGWNMEEGVGVETCALLFLGVIVYN